jgi:hypothetical protein
MTTDARAELLQGLKAGEAWAHAAIDRALSQKLPSAAIVFVRNLRSAELADRLRRVFPERSSDRCIAEIIAIGLERAMSGVAICRSAPFNRLAGDEREDIEERLRAILVWGPHHCDPDRGFLTERRIAAIIGAKFMAVDISRISEA